MQHLIQSDFTLLIAAWAACLLSFSLQPDLVTVEVNR